MSRPHASTTPERSLPLTKVKEKIIHEIVATSSDPSISSMKNKRICEANTHFLPPNRISIRKFSTWLCRPSFDQVYNSNCISDKFTQCSCNEMIAKLSTLIR